MRIKLPKRGRGGYVVIQLCSVFLFFPQVAVAVIPVLPLIPWPVDCMMQLVLTAVDAENFINSKSN